MSENRTVKIMLDYLQGPIWISDVETGEPMTGIAIIDNDPVLPALNKECGMLFSDCYEFDTHDTACWFNKEKELANRDKMLTLINQIKFRLEEINDGSFVIDDCESERLRNL